MFCFGNKSKTNKNTTSVPQGIMKPEKKARNGLERPDNDSVNVSAAPVDLRAEHDEPVDDSVKLMDYLMT